MTIKYAGIPEQYRGYEVPRSIREKLLRTQDALKKFAVVVAQTNEDGRDEMIRQTDKQFKKTLDSLRKIDLVNESVQNTVAYCRQNQLDKEEASIDNILDTQVDGLDEKFKTTYESKHQEHSSLGQSARFGNGGQVERAYDQFRRAIFRVTHDADEEMPPLRTYFDDYNEDDEDLVVAQERIEYKCPLTKHYYVNPVTSIACGHSFEKEAILAMFSRSGDEIKCPVPACSHHFTARLLQPNEELLVKAQAQKEREIRESELRNQALERV